MAESDCIFCKIAAGEVGDLIYENEHAAAFNDLNPLAPVHVLVVPKTHHANICDGVEAETLAAMVEAVRAVVAQAGLEESGYRVVSNTGSDAGQTVFHLHWHILGGQQLGVMLGTN